MDLTSWIKSLASLTAFFYTQLQPINSLMQNYHFEIIGLVFQGLLVAITGFGAWIAWKALDRWKKEVRGKHLLNICDNMLLNNVQIHSNITNMYIHAMLAPYYQYISADTYENDINEIRDKLRACFEIYNEYIPYFGTRFDPLLGKQIDIFFSNINFFYTILHKFITTPITKEHLESIVKSVNKLNDTYENNSDKIEFYLQDIARTILHSGGREIYDIAYTAEEKEITNSLIFMNDDVIPNYWKITASLKRLDSYFEDPFKYLKKD